MAQAIQVFFGEKKYKTEVGTSLLYFLEYNRQEALVGCAVAVNKVFVPRSEYANRILQEGDIVALVRPMQGG